MNHCGDDLFRPQADPPSKPARQRSTRCEACQRRDLTIYQNTLRPHLALGLGHIVVWTVQLFFEWLSAAATELLREALSDLDERLSIVDRAHEQYLSGREWPAI